MIRQRTLILAFVIMRGGLSAQTVDTGYAYDLAPLQPTDPSQCQSFSDQYAAQLDRINSEHQQCLDEHTNDPAQQVNNVETDCSRSACQWLHTEMHKAKVDRSRVEKETAACSASVQHHKDQLQREQALAAQLRAQQQNTFNFSQTISDLERALGMSPKDAMQVVRTENLISQVFGILISDPKYAGASRVQIADQAANALESARNGFFPDEFAFLKDVDLVTIADAEHFAYAYDLSLGGEQAGIPGNTPLENLTLGLLTATIADPAYNLCKAVAQYFEHDCFPAGNGPQAPPNFDLWALSGYLAAMNASPGYVPFAGTDATPIKPTAASDHASVFLRKIDPVHPLTVAPLEGNSYSYRVLAGPPFESIRVPRSAIPGVRALTLVQGRTITSLLPDQTYTFSPPVTMFTLLGFRSSATTKVGLSSTKTQSHTAPLVNTIGFAGSGTAVFVQTMNETPFQDRTVAHESPGHQPVVERRTTASVLPQRNTLVRPNVAAERNSGEGTSKAIPAASDPSTRASRAGSLTENSACTAVNNMVTVSSHWRTGVGAMDHEVVVTVTNNASFPVTVSVRYHKKGRYEPASDGLINLKPGQTLSGEMAGLYDVGDDDSNVIYVAYRKDSNDNRGHTCSGFPR